MKRATGQCMGDRFQVAPPAKSSFAAYKSAEKMTSAAIGAPTSGRTAAYRTVPDKRASAMVLTMAPAKMFLIQQRDSGALTAPECSTKQPNETGVNADPDR